MIRTFYCSFGWYPKINKIFQSCRKILFKSMKLSFHVKFDESFSNTTSFFPLKTTFMQLHYLCLQIFLGFWVLFSLLITTYYKTSLMSVLAVPSIPPAMNYLEQLLHSDLGYGMIDVKVRLFY